jgi:uncharacterized surface protein with fasciclin (FAS1) repeats
MTQRRILKNVFFAFWLLLSSISFNACEDMLPGGASSGENEPAWLKASIYDYLKEDGHFTYFVRIIDSIILEDGSTYKEQLQKTGSRTLFVADDNAFKAFFADNIYGIRKFEDLSLAQRKAIFLTGMLEDAYLVNMLSNISGIPPIAGQAMRRTTAWNVIDSIPFEAGDHLPANHYWDRFREKGLFLMKDNSDYTMVHFTGSQMKTQGITGEDFKTITKMDWQDTAYVFDIKIKQRDIICKNGYVNVLEKLMFPRENMAEYIHRNPKIQTFNTLLERFCAPYFSFIHPVTKDSVFEKRFFNTHRQSEGYVVQDPNKQVVKAWLNFNPEENSFKSDNSATALHTDMGAIFVPSDEALENYFNGAAGKFLRERYSSWENVPDDVLAMLINNHMRSSFLSSIPSRFYSLTDKMGTPMGVQVEDIEDAYICSNGIVYVTNKVYSPTEYISVMAPVQTNLATTVFNWAISQYKFNLYLLAMEEDRTTNPPTPLIYYSLLVPTDSVFNNYVDPASIARQSPVRLKFWMNPKTLRVNATAYNINTGDSINQPPITDASVIESCLMDILDNHIVVGNIEDGKEFYQTKGGATIRVKKGPGNDIAISGGANLERNETVMVTNTYDGYKNGTTYLLDHILQPSLRSVYDVLKNNPDYSQFYNLCSASAPYDAFNPDSARTIRYGGNIFANDAQFAGLTMNVAFFNTFNYTVYVPTNQAVLDAIANGEIKTWAAIGNITDKVQRGEETQKLYNFLRYHFQDNSIYISGESKSPTKYNTATRIPNQSKFYQITVSSDGSNLNLLTANGGNASVDTTKPGNFNVMARDYKLNTSDATKVQSISTSSYAVIHQINTILKYE